MEIVIDRDHNEGLFSPVCTKCRHLHFLEGRVCDAFPERIPSEIWLGKNKHVKPYPGDHGIQFEPGTPQGVPPEGGG